MLFNYAQKNSGKMYHKRFAFKNLYRHKNSQINDSVYMQIETTSQLINCEFFTHSHMRSKIFAIS